MMKKTILGLSMVAMLGAVPIAGAPALEACTPAARAQAVDLTELVAADLAAGKTYPEIEADVTRALQAMDASVLEIDVAAIVEDAILLLVDLKRLPPSAISNAVGVRANAHAARKAPAP